MSEQKLSAFEVGVIQLALRGDASWRRALRDQIPNLRLKERKVTGSGFYSHFEFIGDNSCAGVSMATGGNPIEDYPPAINAIRLMPEKGLVSFIVWLDGRGIISTLEAVSLTDDLWPSNIFQGFVDFQDDSGVVIQKAIEC
jgi:hypothetical protein